MKTGFWEAYMNKIQKWLEKIGWLNCRVEIASADASFRQYFRIVKDNRSYILMDSSLEKESLAPYINVTNILLAAGVKAPEIFEKDLEEGYLIIEDFGSVHYLNVLNKNNYKTLYNRAIDEIVKMQRADASSLPLYDRDFLHFEMDLMKEWFFKKYLKMHLGDNENMVIDRTLEAISDTVLSQPQGLFVHRDYHSRNIMLTSKGDIGMIDYQDAMRGALTYDLVSLLKDCYIRFEPKEIEKLALSFRDKKGLDTDDETFLKWFDFMGMQRHIKVLGIFARLYLRDGKSGYLDDLPLTLRYTLEAADKYEETRPLAKLLQKVRLP
jgi:aminoglycoside/choline kinase family phosphotransferase